MMTCFAILAEIQINVCHVQQQTMQFPVHSARTIILTPAKDFAYIVDS